MEFLKTVLNKLPYISGLNKFYQSYHANSCFPPAHFYSPLVDSEYAKSRQDVIWNDLTKPEIQDVDIRATEQLQLIQSFKSYYSDSLFAKDKNTKSRYFYDNGFYGFTDAFLLQSFIRHFKPKRVIEVGSGFSSAVMLDTRDQFGIDLDFSFIEPYPERLYSLLRDSDKTTSRIITQELQNVDLSTFSALEKGDILFIDSTHVAKTGSDVNYVIFQILPQLKSGVLIHFHDVFYPFEYPKEWVFEGRNWNEDYILRAFLMNNDKYAIRLFSHFLFLHHNNEFKEMPLCHLNWGGCIWLEKL